MKRSKKLVIILAIAVLGLVAVSTQLFISHGRAGNAAVALAPVAVEVTRVNTTTVTAKISAVGTISAMRDVQVSSETAGRVTRVLVNVGDYVRTGQTLVQVDDELKAIAVDQAKAQLIAAETSFNKAEKDHQRAQTLRSNGDISDAEYEAYRLAYRSTDAQFRAAQVALRFAQRQLDDTRIKAPVSGYIASRNIEVGEMVDNGKNIANIVDLSSIKVKLSVPEEEIGKLRTGQPAMLQVDAIPGDMYDGSVHSISSKTETPTGHTYAVEVVVKPKNRNSLKVGMFGRVEITVAQVTDAVAIPKEVLVSEEGTQAYVFVAEGNIASRREITIGVRSDDLVHVVNGLKSGDLVVSFGQKKLKDGSPIQFAM